MIGVYVALCKSNGRYYVGSSCDIAKRKSRHLKDLRKGKHHNSFFQRVFNKYGEESFVWKIKQVETIEQALALEQHYLYKSTLDGKAMNIGLGATGGDNLTRHPRRVEIIAQMRETLAARMKALTKEERKALFGSPGVLNPRYGVKHTLETRKKMSDAVQARGFDHLKGIRKSAKGRANITAAAQARAQADGYVNAFAGKSHSEETRQRCSAVNIGRKPPNRRKIRVGKKTYDSLKDCAKDLGVVIGTVWHRLKSENFPEYSYVT